jgi:ABC-type ATPase involved in cell division
MEKIIELSECSFDPIKEGKGLSHVNFTLPVGALYALSADRPDDGHLFLRAIAALNEPVSGEFFFRGRKLRFSNHRNLLSYRKKIGYIASDSALIGNKSLRENIMLMHSYCDDSPDPLLSEEAQKLCSLFKLSDKMELRPAQLHREDFRLSIVVRELAKSPEVILIEHPRDLISPENFSLLIGVLKEAVCGGISLLILSSDEEFVRELSHRRFWIENGTLNCE